MIPLTSTVDRIMIKRHCWGDIFLLFQQQEVNILSPLVYCNAFTDALKQTLKKAKQTNKEHTMYPVNNLKRYILNGECSAQEQDLTIRVFVTLRCTSLRVLLSLLWI